MEMSSKIADAAGQALEKPHMRARGASLDMTEALATNLAKRDFHAALVANYAAVLHALVLAAQAFPVRDGAKNLWRRTGRRASGLKVR